MNWNQGNVFFITDFDDNMESSLIVPLIKEIQNQRRLRDGSLDLYVNSFGGYRHLAFQIVSLLEIAKRDGIRVRTIINDIAYSAGSIVAIAGTPGERYIEKNAEHLIHYGFTASSESTPEQIERNYLQKKEGFDKIKRHYQKYANVPNLEELMNDDNAFIPAAKCIKFGLADKYLEKFDIGRDD